MSSGRFTNVTGSVEEMFNLIFDPRVLKICTALWREKNLSIPVLHRRTGLGSLTVRGTVSRLLFARMVERSERNVLANRTFEHYGLTQLGKKIMPEINAIGLLLPEGFTGKHAIALMDLHELKKLEKAGLVEFPDVKYKVKSKGEEIASHLMIIHNIIFRERCREVRRIGY